MFNDKFQLAKAVLEGRKTQTRRIIKCPRTFKGEDVRGFYKGQCGSEDTHLMDAFYFKGDIQPYCTPREAYAVLIDKVSGEGTWESNPWVFVYDFELIK